MSTRSGKNYCDLDERKTDDSYQKKERKIRTYISIHANHYEHATIDKIDFDCLPIVVFDFIHSYLSHSDYRQLMNYNKCNFYPIKYETVYYHLCCPSLWKERTLSKDQKLKYCIDMITNNVKNKNKQVEMTLVTVTDHLLIKYADLLQGIAKVNIEVSSQGYPDREITSVQPLHGISHVKLKGLAALESLDGLEEAKIVEVESCNDLIDISAISNAEKVVFNGCLLLEDMKPLKNVPDAAIFKCFSVRGLSDLDGGYHEKLDFINEEARIDRLFPIVRGISSFLSISCNFSSCDMSITSNPSLISSDDGAYIEKSSITILKLTHQLRHFFITQHIYPVLPCVFPAVEQLKLGGFNLTLWENKPFSSLHTLVLGNCIINDFSMFRDIKFLRFTRPRCDFLDYRVFSKLEALCISQRYPDEQYPYVRFNKELTTIGLLPHLQSFKIETSGIFYFPVLNNITHLELIFCQYLTCLGPLYQAKTCSLLQ
jgi:hypothetical protein